MKTPNPRHTAGTIPARKDQRSAVTNGKRLFIVSPGDNAWSRRFRDVLAAITNDLGGPTVLSEGQRQLIRRATMIALSCEQMESAAASGEMIDLDAYGTMTDRLGRCFHRLGLKRIARDIDDADAFVRVIREGQRRPHA